MEERRRFPRQNAVVESISIPASLSVRVLDISASGALVESRNRIEPGSRGRLQMSLGDTSVAFDVQVLRTAKASGANGGYRLGTKFLALDLAQQHLIERFVTP